MGSRVALLLLAIVLTSTGFGSAQLTRLVGDCVQTDVVQTFSLFPSDFRVESDEPALSTEVKFAQEFSVEYFNHYKVVRNLRANETYVLYQCGVTKPQNASVPADAKYFQIPLYSVLIPDTTVLHFMEQLSVEDRIGYVTGYAVEPCMQRLAAKSCGGRTEIEQWQRNLTLVDEQSLRSDAIIRGDDCSKNERGWNKTICFTATTDPGVLKRAEWVKMLAPFFNKEREANAVFELVSSNYNSYTAAAAKLDMTDKPVVAWATRWGNGAPRDPEGIRVYVGGYRQEYVEAAGGKMLNISDILASKYVANVTCRNSSDQDVACTKDSQIMFISYNGANATRGPVVLEAIFANVSVLIDETYFSTLPPQTDEALYKYAFNTTASKGANLRFLQQQRVFRNDRSSTAFGTTDMYERAVGRPDEFLRELVKVLHPNTTDALFRAPLSRYFRSVFAPETHVLVTAENCTSFQGCRKPAAQICPYVFTNCTSGQLSYVTADNRCPVACSPPPSPFTVRPPPPSTSSVPSPTPSPTPSPVPSPGPGSFPAPRDQAAAPNAAHSMVALPSLLLAMLAFVYPVAMLLLL